MWKYRLVGYIFKRKNCGNVFYFNIVANVQQNAQFGGSPENISELSMVRFKANRPKHWNLRITYQWLSKNTPTLYESCIVPYFTGTLLVTVQDHYNKSSKTNTSPWNVYLVPPRRNTTSPTCIYTLTFKLRNIPIMSKLFGPDPASVNTYQGWEHAMGAKYLATI